MSLKTILQKWLGIEQPTKRVSAARAYQAPIKITYHDGESIKHVGTHYLPFEQPASETKGVNEIHTHPKGPKMRRYGETPRTAKRFYQLCGGAPVFDRIMRYKNWYTINQRNNDPDYPFVLILLDNDYISDKGNAESRSLRAKSRQHAERLASELVEVHSRANFRN